VLSELLYFYLFFLVYVELRIDRIEGKGFPSNKTFDYAYSC